jgi:hypothetical protein
MIVKDVIKQGYPFVEAIASTLPICDEFLVSDGYSTDGTFEVLQRISSLNKKVKVFQCGWARRELTILGDVSNELRKKCKSDYLFYIQAAEVVHEENVKMLKAVPEIFPKTDTFCLPFTFVISNLKVNEEFRLRFCRNLSRINLTGDAWAFSVSKKFIRSEAISNLKRPKKLLNYVGRGIEWAFAGSLNHLRSRALYLPKPIFRYQALFKGDFIERCKGHAWHFNLPYFYDVIKDVEKEEGEAFFEKAAQLYRSGFEINYRGALGVTKIEEHPKIIQEFITNRKTIPHYYVRDCVLEAIANA